MASPAESSIRRAKGISPLKGKTRETDTAVATASESLTQKSLDWRLPGMARFMLWVRSRWGAARAVFDQTDAPSHCEAPACRARNRASSQ